MRHARHNALRRVGPYDEISRSALRPMSRPEYEFNTVMQTGMSPR